MNGKRPLDAAASTSAKQKQVKTVHGFFAPPVPLEWRVKDDEQLWHVVYGKPEGRAKAAIFDLDDCLTRKLPKGAWKWFADSVPVRLRKAEADGFAVFIVSNQGVAKSQLGDLRKRFEEVLRKLAIPCHLFAAMGDSWYRKPMPGIFDLIKQECEADLNRDDCLFVGDAAGRAGDHSDSDRKWAFNAGVPFQTPEQYFLDRAAQPYQLRGFDAKAYMAKSAPIFQPQNSPLVRGDKELVVTVGPRCSGKSTTFHHHFASHGYLHVEAQGTTALEMVDCDIARALENGQRVYLEDSTASRSARRTQLRSLAASLDAGFRILRSSMTEMHCWHNNLYRAFAPHTTGPKAAYIRPEDFATAIDEILETEADEVKTINFVFKGTDEERQRYGMWLGVNRKAANALEGKRR